MGMRWNLLTEIVSIDKGTAAVSRGEIPDVNIGYEALVLEIMAQTGGVLLGAESDFSQNVVVAKIQSAFFYRKLKSGTPLEIRVAADSHNGDGARLSAVALEGVQIAATAGLLLISAGHLLPGVARSITFHPAFMSFYRVREKIRPRKEELLMPLNRGNAPQENT